MHENLIHDDRKRGIFFHARMSFKYPHDMESRYSAFMSYTAVCSILFSSVGFTSFTNLLSDSPLSGFIDKETVGIACLFVITLSNSIALGMGFPGKIEKHGYFKRKWVEIEKRLVILKDDAEILKLEEKLHQMREAAGKKGRSKKVDKDW